MEANNKTLVTIRAALGAALIFTSGMLIRIPNPVNGYFNLSDAVILLFSSILPPVPAMIASGLGSGLIDVAGGYPVYFLFTLLIKGLEGFMVSAVIKRYGRSARFGIWFAACIWMVFGYFLTQCLLSGSPRLAALNIPSDLLQGALSYVIALAIWPAFERLVSRREYAK